MTYTLDAFIKDAKAALKANNGPAGREQVRVLLEKLLGKQVVRRRGGRARRADRHAQALRGQGSRLRRAGPLQPKPHKSPPHDHGASWAVYGQAVKYTDMSEYKRLDGGRGAGEASARAGQEPIAWSPAMPASTTSAPSMPSTIPKAAASCASPAAISITCSG